jgi:hypothetical protein
MPVDTNSTKKETVIELLECLIRLSKMQFAEWQAGPSKEAPISDDLLFFVGDGDPIKTCAGIIENTTTGRHSKVRPPPGALHGFMGILQEDKPTQRGELVSSLIAPFYTKGDSKEATDNNICYFVDFNDPTVPER